MAEGWSYRLTFGERTIDLKSDKLTVGRSRRCDVAINDPSVSRKHVFLTLESGRIVLQDLGSSNGTFVNEERITTDMELYDGDSLRLGDAELAIEVSAGSGQGLAVPGRPDPAPEGPRILSGSSALPTGSSVAILAPPLGELPGSSAGSPAPWNPDAGETLEGPPPGPPEKAEHGDDPAEAITVEQLKVEELKPVFDRPAPTGRLSTPLSTPPDMLKMDDSLALMVEPSEEKDEGDDLFPGLREIDGGFAATAAGEVWDEEEQPEETAPVTLLRLGELAGPARRVSAQLLDAVWVAALAWAGDRLFGQSGALLAAGTAALALWLGWGIWGASPGKWALGLQIVSITSDRQGIGFSSAATRLAAFVAGTLALGIGPLMAVLTPAKLALHDRLAETRVIRRDPSDGF